MKQLYKFTVPGTPVAKGRPVFARRGKSMVAYTPEKTVNYETLVQLEFMNQYPGVKPTGEPLKVEIDAYFPILKSTSKKNRELMELKQIRHTKKPDADNIAKGIADSLNTVAWCDDSQIVELVVRKYYSSVPGVFVAVWEM